MNDRFRMLPSYYYEDNTDGVLLKSVGKTLKDYRIYGNSHQNETPSLDNPIEIQSVGELTKNLFDESLLLEISSVVKTDEGYVFNSYPSVFTESSKLIKHLKTTLKAGVTYTLSRELIGYSGSMCGSIWIRDSSNVLWGVNYNDGIKSVTFTPTQEEIDSIATVYIYGKKNINSQIFKYIQLEEGDTSTEYEPYGKYKIPITVSNGSETTTINIYLDEPLRKVGDYEEYADYIDFRTKKVVRNIGVYTFKGTEDNKGGVNNSSIMGIAICINNSSQRGDIARVGLCNYMPQGGYTYRTAFGFYDAQSHPYVYISLKKADFPDYEEYTSSTVFEILKELYDSGNPLKLYYQLQIPTEESIELPEIPTYKGTNIITVGTSLQPSAVNYQYYKRSEMI